MQNGALPEVAERQYGCTPLHWAASSGNTQFCRLLCNAGAIPGTLDSNGTDAVAYAEQCEDGDGDCVEFLRSLKNQMGQMNGLTTPGATPGGGGPPKHGRFDESQWSKASDDEGNVYYVNNNTHESIWEEEWNAKKANVNAATPASVGGGGSVAGLVR